MSVTQQQITAVEKISHAERDSLSTCEAIIERGLRSFYEVGAALTRIRDERLYRATYGTFEEYCLKRWNWGKAYAYRQIAAAEVVANLSPIGDVPQTESQARPLVGLRPQEQRVVWGKAVEESKGKQPTAAKVEEVAKRIRQLLQKGIDKLRRAERGADAPDPISRQKAQEQLIANSSQNAIVFRFIQAIETFSELDMTMQDLALKIIAMDTPDRDWRGKASTAQQNLTQLVKALK
jgi:hypothetical protein